MFIHTLCRSRQIGFFASISYLNFKSFQTLTAGNLSLYNQLSSTHHTFPGQQCAHPTFPRGASCGDFFAPRHEPMAEKNPTRSFVIFVQRPEWRRSTASRRANLCACSGSAPGVVEEIY